MSFAQHTFHDIRDIEAERYAKAVVHLHLTDRDGSTFTVAVDCDPNLYDALDVIVEAVNRATKASNGTIPLARLDALHGADEPAEPSDPYRKREAV